LTHSHFLGAVAAIIYAITYFLILRNPEHSFFRVKVGFPLIVGFCVAIYAAMFVLKGASNKSSDEWGVKETVDNAKSGDGSKLVIICVSAFLVSGFCAACLVPFVAKQVLERVEEREQQRSQKSIEDANMLEYGNKKGEMVDDKGDADKDMAPKNEETMPTEKIYPDDVDVIPVVSENCLYLTICLFIHIHK
jgi:hypothetical protein